MPTKPAAGRCARGGVAAAAQSAGPALATVTQENLASSIDAVGTLGFNEREVAIVQTRSAGFVEKVYARAPGDVVAAGAPLADLLVPEWAGAQQEYLAVRATGDGADGCGPRSACCCWAWTMPACANWNAAVSHAAG
jgi:Cu(I)/Ag(I) efflux system membrane fusion protein